MKQGIAHFHYLLKLGYNSLCPLFKLNLWILPVLSLCFYFLWVYWPVEYHETITFSESMVLNCDMLWSREELVILNIESSLIRKVTWYTNAVSGRNKHNGIYNKLLVMFFTETFFLAAFMCRQNIFVSLAVWRHHTLNYPTVNFCQFGGLSALSPNIPYFPNFVSLAVCQHLTLSYHISITLSVWRFVGTLP